ncbi:hypothetical protein, partial [Vibrio barjaei]|uniref:hypothetical protein n=1 Tax=Vibrio barjaei TaxID=1676683 RepID=UPI0023E40E66
FKFDFGTSKASAKRSIEPIRLSIALDGKQKTRALALVFLWANTFLLQKTKEADRLLYKI